MLLRVSEVGCIHKNLVFSNEEEVGEQHVHWNPGHTQDADAFACIGFPVQVDSGIGQ